MTGWTSIFVLCSVLNPSLCCDWLRHYNYYSNVSLTHLRRMGDQLTEQESPVSFPYRLYTHIRNTEVESQLVFIRDSLDQISDLYCHDNLSSFTWDTDTTHHFRMSVGKMMDGLNTCVSPKKQTDNRLRKYYRRLSRSTLYCTGGSSACWEIIRKETELHLDQLQLLVSSILAPDAATRRRCNARLH